MVAVIFAIEFILCFAEGWRAVNCHNSGGGYWNWFFAFAANFPFSFTLETIRGYLQKVISIVVQVRHCHVFFYLLDNRILVVVNCFTFIDLFYKYTRRAIGDR